MRFRKATETGVDKYSPISRHSRAGGNPQTNGTEANMDKQPCVYLLASKRNGTLYVGVTADLIRRTWEHKEHLVEGFTNKYQVGTLVWFEPH